MKILKKADIIKLKQVDHVISENTILADIDHPFLVSLNILIRSETLMLMRKLGRSERIFTGSSLLVFPDGLYPWWRALHLFENRGETSGGPCYVLPGSFKFTTLGSTQPR
jgi:hypothetical protein